MPRTTPELLKDARDLIEKHGWVQYKMGSRGEGYCVVGAIVAVTSSNQEAVMTFEALGRAADEYSVAQWNDIPGRTREQVLGLFDKALGALE